MGEPMTTHPDEHRSEIVRPVGDPTTFALDLVRSEMGRRFDSLDKRLDSMVTRDVHDATVQRLDAADEQLRRDLDAHKDDAEERFVNVERSVTSGDKAILASLDQERDERRKSRRWAIGAVIGTGGLAVSATALLVNVLA